METLTAIVAGGAGFIGSHLCRSLLDQGKNVIAVDDLSTGSINNLSGIAQSPRFDFIRHDITEPLDLHTKVHEIYNLACPASPLHYQAQPVRTLLTSVLGSYRLLELARHKRAKILLASTSEVYGDPLVTPQPEDYRGNVSSTGIRSCYDEGKRGAESLGSSRQRIPFRRNNLIYSRIMERQRNYTEPVNVIGMFPQESSIFRWDEPRNSRDIPLGCITDRQWVTSTCRRHVPTIQEILQHPPTSRREGAPNSQVCKHRENN